MKFLNNIKLLNCQIKKINKFEIYKNKIITYLLL